MGAAQAKLAFQVISERYDYPRSTCITTNRPFKDWPKVFPDALNAQVVAERLTERAELRLQRQGLPHRTLTTSRQPRPTGDDSSVSEKPRSDSTLDSAASPKATV
jgi:hypothetical protein